MTNSTTRSMPINRRRFISIAAAMAGAVVALPRSGGAVPPRIVTWRGIALGAPAMLTLQHPNEPEAKDAISACLAEVARLEVIFSLHRADSELMRLNRSGRLENASADMRVLLAEALLIAERSAGAFDPTIQPLWEHQARTGVAAAHHIDDFASVRALVGWQNVKTDGSAVWFSQPGMAMTLNGIAQGYITDRVGDVLRARGFANVLVDMGEQLAVGPKWDGTAWHVGICDAKEPSRIMETLPLTRGAVATSSNPENSGRFAHILDPRTGRPPDKWASITVVSDCASFADGLSTALTLLPLDQWPALTRNDARVYAVPLGAQVGNWV
jgi:thiamine biosynthesis lipoprotein